MQNEKLKLSVLLDQQKPIFSKGKSLMNLLLVVHLLEKQSETLQKGRQVLEYFILKFLK